MRKKRLQKARRTTKKPSAWRPNRDVFQAEGFIFCFQFKIWAIFSYQAAKQIEFSHQAATQAAFSPNATVKFAFFPRSCRQKHFFPQSQRKKRHFHSKSLEKARFCQTNTLLFGAKPPIFNVVRNLSIYIFAFSPKFTHAP